MRSRAAGLAALSFAIAAVAAGGCRRTPFTTSTDAGSDAGAPSVGDAALADGLDAAMGGDAPAADVANNDVATADVATADAAIADVANTDAQSIDHAPTDTGTDAAPADAAPDLASADAPATDGAAADRAMVDGAADSTDVRPEDELCGSLGVACLPFACDVARGICKTSCTTNDDCFTGKTCNTTVGVCGLKEDDTCLLGGECRTGYCAQGVCCNTACVGPCRSCALAGTRGTCTPVAAGSPDPVGTCPTGSVCDGSGGCTATCTGDSTCEGLTWCTNGRCTPCAATCVSSAECAIGAVCIHRNACSYCAPGDAGAGG